MSTNYDFVTIYKLYMTLHFLKILFQLYALEENQTRLDYKRISVCEKFSSEDT